MRSGRHGSRTRFVTGIAAGAFGVASIPRLGAGAAQFEFKCGGNLPLDHPSTSRITEMWRAIEKESGGRIHTQFYPNSVLGNDPALFAQLRVGALQFFLATPGILAGLVPAANITYLGFAFKDSDEALRVHDGPLGAYVAEQVAGKNIQLMRTMWDSGMRVVGSSTRPIRSPEDLRGMKVRAVESSITIDLFKALGASPTPISPPEVYTALQTKLVDGEDAPMVTIETSRWFEVNKYISLTNHAYSGLWMIANGDAWKSLPADLQSLVERNMSKYARIARRDTKAYNSSVADKLARQGIVINSVDQAPFRARLRSYYENWQNVFGPTEWGLLTTGLGRSL